MGQTDVEVPARCPSCGETLLSSGSVVAGEGQAGRAVRCGDGSCRLAEEEGMGWAAGPLRCAACGQGIEKEGF